MKKNLKLKKNKKKEVSKKETKTRNNLKIELKKEIESDIKEKKNDEKNNDSLDSEEVLESEIVNPGTTFSFRYPFFKNIPSIKIQPVVNSLEEELSEIDSRKEGSSQEKYKPFDLNKNYSLNQEYRLQNEFEYERLNPKMIKSSEGNVWFSNTNMQNPIKFNQYYRGNKKQSEKKYDYDLEKRSREKRNV